MISLFSEAACLQPGDVSLTDASSCVDLARAGALDEARRRVESRHRPLCVENW
jgi:hypothetical protein